MSDNLKPEPVHKETDEGAINEELPSQSQRAATPPAPRRFRSRSREPEPAAPSQITIPDGCCTKSEIREVKGKCPFKHELYYRFSLVNTDAVAVDIDERPEHCQVALKALNSDHSLVFSSDDIDKKNVINRLVIRKSALNEMDLLFDAVAQRRYFDLSKDFPNIAFLSLEKGSTITKNCLLFVVTIDVMRLLLFTGSDRFGNGIVIFDDCDFIGDSTKGSFYEETIAMLEFSGQFARWLTVIFNRAVEAVTVESVVSPIQHFVSFYDGGRGETMNLIVDKKGKFYEDGLKFFETEKTGSKSKKPDRKNYELSLFELQDTYIRLIRTARGLNEVPILVYCQNTENMFLPKIKYIQSNYKFTASTVLNSYRNTAASVRDARVDMKYLLQKIFTTHQRTEVSKEILNDIRNKSVMIESMVIRDVEDLERYDSLINTLDADTVYSEMMKHENINGWLQVGRVIKAKYNGHDFGKGLILQSPGSKTIVCAFRCTYESYEAEDPKALRPRIEGDPEIMVPIKIKITDITRIYEECLQLFVHANFSNIRDWLLWCFTLDEKIFTEYKELDPIKDITINDEHFLGVWKVYQKNLKDAEAIKKLSDDFDERWQVYYSKSRIYKLILLLLYPCFHPAPFRIQLSQKMSTLSPLKTPKCFKGRMIETPECDRFQKFKASTFLYSHTGEVHGEVIIEQKSYNPSHINVSVRGLPPGCYGIHIHQYGDQTNGCISAGSHYSPYEFLPHANPLEDGYNFNLTRHAGDLGNIDVGEDGSGTATLIDNMVVLYGKMSVAGRLFTIKNKEDKFGIQKDDVIAYFGTIGYDVPSYHIYRVKNKFAGIMTAEVTNRAVAVLRGELVTGIVYFTQEKEGEETTIHGKLENLTTGFHGIAIYKYTSFAIDDLNSPHFNPFGVTHGGPNDVNRHVGDMGNIEADSDGVAEFEYRDNVIQLHGPNSIVGRSLVCHAETDDLGKGEGDKKEESLKTGNAGARVACGVIGWAAKV